MVIIVEVGGSSGDQASDAMNDGSSPNQILVTGSNPNIAAKGGSSCNQLVVRGSNNPNVDQGVGMYRATIEKLITSFVRITVMRYGITRDLKIRHIGNLLTRTAPVLYSSWESMAISIFRFWVSDVSQAANTSPTWRRFCVERVYRRPESQVTPAFCWPGGVPAFGKLYPTTIRPGLAFDNLSWQFFNDYVEVKEQIDTMIVIEPFMVVMDP